jgi:hypothetical protein
MSAHVSKVPFGSGIWGVVLASAIAIVLVFTYVQGPRSLTRGAFAVAAVAVLARQMAAFWSRSGQTR